MSDLARRLMFRRGFRDGAYGSALKHEDNSDYMEGWEAGRTHFGIAAEEFRERHGIAPPTILRAQGDSEDKDDRPRHVCGLQGFGEPDDVCPGCEDRAARREQR